MVSNCNPRFRVLHEARIWGDSFDFWILKHAYVEHSKFPTRILYQSEHLGQPNQFVLSDLYTGMWCILTNTYHVPPAKDRPIISACGGRAETILAIKL